MYTFAKLTCYTCSFNVTAEIWLIRKSSHVVNSVMRNFLSVNLYGCNNIDVSNYKSAIDFGRLIEEGIAIINMLVYSTFTRNVYHGDGVQLIGLEMFLLLNTN